MRTLGRRRLIKYGVAAGGAAVLTPWLSGAPRADAAMGGKLTKYLEPVPLPGAGIVVATPQSTGAVTTYAFRQTQIARRLHPQLPPTPLWAYDDGSGLSGQSGSLGMVIIAKTGTPVHVDYTNDL
ncbi:MAG TPA: hypothetical protein VF902_08285, partial [Coriobacteriia bacterium]